MDNCFCKNLELEIPSLKKSFSKRQEKNIFDKRKYRNVLKICWIEPNNFIFMIFTPKNVLLLHYGLVTLDN